MNIRRTFAGAAAATIAATSLVACASDSEDTTAEGSDEPIRIGTTDANLPEWDVFTDLAEADGIDVEVVPFSDYNPVNDALVQNQIDVNKFQHLNFLAGYNNGAGADLTPISSTEIYPLALFWDGHDSLEGIEGENIAIPNDSTNQGRAINVLVQAGLVTLHEEGMLNPAPADVDTEASEVTITAIDAAQTTAVYHEGAPAVINNSFLERASIDPLDAIFQDDPNNEEAEPYINVWVTTQERADDETIARLAELWADQSVTDAIMESSGNTAVTVERPREELVEILERLQEQDAE